MANDTKARVEGIYFNSSDSPVFLEGKSVGGHDYVFIEGFLRVPGHFVLVQDPQDDPDAPETFREAYKAMMEKGTQEKVRTHEHSRNSRSNVITMEEDTEEDTEKTEEKEEAPKPTKTSRTARKGKRDSTSSDEGAQ